MTAELSLGIDLGSQVPASRPERSPTCRTGLDLDTCPTAT